MAGHVVIAPDKFTGSLAAAEAARTIAVGLERADPILTTMQCLVADGGDGTLGTVLAAGFEQIPVYATGPTGQVVRTRAAVGRRSSKWRKSVACNGFPVRRPPR